MQQNYSSFPVSCLMQSHQKLWQPQLFWRELGNMLRGQCNSGQVPFSSRGIRIGTISPSPALVSTPNHCNRNKYYFPRCWKALQQLCNNIGSKKKKKKRGLQLILAYTFPKMCKVHPCDLPSHQPVTLQIIPAFHPSITRSTNKQPNHHK